MFIKSNIEAMSSYIDMSRIDRSFNKSLAKISSGMELPKPMFNGGMYAAANDMEAIYQSYVTGAKNVQDGQGFLEVAQTVMMEVNDLIFEMNDLAHRASTETINDEQRAQMDVAYQRLKKDIGNVILDVKFNELSIWSNTNAGLTLSIVFGENRSFEISTYNMASTDFQYDGTNISSQVNAGQSMSAMETAVNYMSQLMAEMGAQITEIEGKVNILNEQAIQEKAMEARINEIDYAKEMKNFMSQQVVLQASQAMVSQANMKPQSVMQLFG